MNMIKAAQRHIPIRQDAPSALPQHAVSFVVLTMARFDGRQGADAIRRYNFDHLPAAMRRYEVESVNHQVHRCELLTVISSRIVER